MNDYLIELRDEKITNIETDRDYHRGCETCDYGSKYINNLNIELEYHSIDIYVNTGRDSLSEGFLIKFFIENVDKIRSLTLNEFVDFIEVTLEQFKEDEEDSVSVYLNNKERSEINGK